MKKKHYSYDEIERKVLRLFKNQSINFSACYDHVPDHDHYWFDTIDTKKTLVFRLDKKTRAIEYMQLFYNNYYCAYFLDLNDMTYHRVK